MTTKEIREKVDKKCYGIVKQHDPIKYANIVAFASVFGKANEDISISTRYQVERYCMGLVSEEVETND